MTKLLYSKVYISIAPKELDFDKDSLILVAIINELITSMKHKFFISLILLDLVIVQIIL